MIHFFKKSVSHIALPEKFTYPFHYTPHPLCVLAAEEVKEYISSRKEWQEELTLGKMFGVLIVQETGKRTRKGREKETKIPSVRPIGRFSAFPRGGRCRRHLPAPNTMWKKQHRFTKRGSTSPTCRSIIAMIAK